MSDEILKVILGLALAYGSAQFAKGGLRWRALNQAKHELEVAQALPSEHPLAIQLHERALGRLERYLHEPTPEERAVKAKLVYYGLMSSLIGAVIAYVYVARPDGWELAAMAFGAACVFAGARELSEKDSRAKSVAGNADEDDPSSEWPSG